MANKMNIDEQERTFNAFTRWTKYSIIAVVVVLLLMAGFLVG